MGADVDSGVGLAAGFSTLEERGVADCAVVGGDAAGAQLANTVLKPMKRANQVKVLGNLNVILLLHIDTVSRRSKTRACTKPERIEIYTSFWTALSRAIPDEMGKQVQVTGVFRNLGRYRMGTRIAASKLDSV